MKLDKLFNPNSVAVIGATNDASKVGYALMKNIVSGGVREIYPVTLRDAEVQGHVAYRSVSAIPGTVDIAIIAVRADIVPAILEECAQKNIHTAVVISAGFKEIGEQGAELETRIGEIAREHNITLLGPNCLGVMNAHAQWNASFSVNSPRKGRTAFVSQSGALGTALLDWANEEGVGFSKFVSLGNEAVLTESDFLEYLADDEETDAVLLYVEQVTDGEAFLTNARRVAQKKPLVVLRAGRSTEGSVAVASHTGSLAPSDTVFEAVLQQVGAISVDSIETLFSLAKLFELNIRHPLQRLVILTNGGGPSVNTTDLVGFSRSLSLTRFSEETKDALRAVLPPMAAVNNPIDVIGDAGPDRYNDTLAILTHNDDIDAILTLVTPQMMTRPKDIADVLLAHTHKKPIIPVFMGGASMQEGVNALNAKGVVNFSTPGTVIQALDALAQGEPKRETPTPTTNTHTHLHMLGYEETRTTLDTYGLSLDGTLVQDIANVEDALHTLGEGPYAMKAISADVVHKSDLSAVRLHLEDSHAVTHAWREIEQHIHEHRPDANIEGMLIQNMVHGVECIVGMKRDPVFGPVIVFGLGGIFVEVVKDTMMRLAPISHEEAIAQIRGIKGVSLLTGARGSTPVDLDALAHVITSLSELSLHTPNIIEIDCNPVFATSNGVRIVDVRLMVE